MVLSPLIIGREHHVALARRVKYEFVQAPGTSASGLVPIQPPRVHWRLGVPALHGNGRPGIAQKDGAVEVLVFAGRATLPSGLRSVAVELMLDTASAQGAARGQTMRDNRLYERSVVAGL